MRLLMCIAAMAFLTNATFAEKYTLGTAEINAPEGWSVVGRIPERLSLQSPDGKQQATLSIMRFGADASFEDFKLICEHRFTAEKRELADGYIKAEPAVNAKNIFTMNYAGEIKSLERVFSGHLSLEKRELVTIYLEGVGVDPKTHTETFHLIMKSFRRKLAPPPAIAAPE